MQSYTSKLLSLWLMLILRDNMYKLEYIKTDSEVLIQCSSNQFKYKG